jgi:hypothetical protein
MVVLAAELPCTREDAATLPLATAGGCRQRIYFPPLSRGGEAPGRQGCLSYKAPYLANPVFVSARRKPHARRKVSIS